MLNRLPPGALDQSFFEPGLLAKARFHARHLAIIGLVIVAQKMQQPVQRQHAQLDRLRVPRLARLPACDSTRDDDIAQVPTSDLRPATADLRPLTSDL